MHHKKQKQKQKNTPTLWGKYKRQNLFLMYKGVMYKCVWQKVFYSYFCCDSVKASVRVWWSGRAVRGGRVCGFLLMFFLVFLFFLSFLLFPFLFVALVLFLLLAHFFLIITRWIRPEGMKSYEYQIKQGSNDT